VTNAEKIRRLPWHIAMNATNTVFAQLTFFGSAFILFLDELNLNASQIGFLLSLLPFFGIVAIFIAPQVARFGYKRTFITFWGTRKFITALLLLIPWVLASFGSEATLLLVTLIVMGFALCRAVAETAVYPWAQEYVPNTIRGKHAATNDMVSRVTSILSIGFAGVVLGLSTGLERYLVLFGIAFIFGLIAVWCASHLPGGAPTQTSTLRYSDLPKVLRDRNFLLYIAGIGILTLGTTPMGSFLPLFMSQQVGLSESAVVWLAIGGTIGGFLMVYFLGWASDRYGSKPVMLSGLYGKALLPIAWLLMPRFSELSLPIALIISVIAGIAEIAWAIGAGRLLYVSVVPYEKRAEYMAMYYTLIGLIGGVSQLIGGVILDFSSGISGQIGGIVLDPFTPLFVGGLILTFISLMVFSRVKAENDISVGEFAAMFTHGNPIGAIESLVRYYRAQDERATVVSTQRMGHTNSPLTVDELLEALKDPRFNVRFEAIISIARMNSDPRLVKALCKILDGTEISTSVIAAWALGRIGNESALPTLRNGLNSPYKSIVAHSARSLGTLGDKASIPLLHERLKAETDKGLRIAYSSALGNLHAEEALNTLFEVLHSTENEGARMELALAIARINDANAADEGQFIRLMRQMRQDKGTAAAQILMTWKRKLDDQPDERFQETITACMNAFAADDFAGALALLRQIIEAMPMHAMNGAYPPGAPQMRTLKECAAHFEASGSKRHEYLLLALHVLEGQVNGKHEKRPER
jgi:MFS family permease